MTAPENGSVDQSEGTTYGKTVMYTCDRGHSLQGDGTRLCQTSGQWTSTTPVCTPVGMYRKVPKFSDARKLCCNLPKIQEKRPNLRVFCQNGANGIANGEDPDQTAPLGAV